MSSGIAILVTVIVFFCYQYIVYIIMNTKHKKILTQMCLYFLCCINLFNCFCFSSKQIEYIYYVKHGHDCKYVLNVNKVES